MTTRRWIRGTAAALAAAVLALPGAALADTVTGGPDWFTDPAALDITALPATQSALQVARQHWGVDVGPITVVVHTTPADGGMWSGTGTNRIVVNADSWPTYRQNALAFCVGIVHEYGHDLGYPHVPDPNSVMYGGDGKGTPMNVWAAARDCVTATGAWVDQRDPARVYYQMLNADTDRYADRPPGSLRGRYVRPRPRALMFHHAPAAVSRAIDSRR